MFIYQYPQEFEPIHCIDFNLDFWPVSTFIFGHETTSCMFVRESIDRLDQPFFLFFEVGESPLGGLQSHLLTILKTLIMAVK